MKIPEAADRPLEHNDRLPSPDEAIFINPYHGRERLTRHEAIDCINILSGELLADGHYRSQAEHPGGVRKG